MEFRVCFQGSVSSLKLQADCTKMTFTGDRVCGSHPHPQVTPVVTWRGGIGWELGRSMDRVGGRVFIICLVIYLKFF